jgi:UPF0042 nucleotide-binding protein
MSVAPSVPAAADRILLVTGMSGAGKTTVLKALEDMDYEAVDSLPLGLLQLLLATPAGRLGRKGDDRPLAFGMDSRTRAFDAEEIVQTIKHHRDAGDLVVRVLFLDCAGDELIRRFSETRRRHPLALDRAAADGIARERELLAPLRRWADVVIDTTDFSTNDLRRVVREKFGRGDQDHLTLTITSFGFARGIPRDADLVFDLRFLSNPHWQPELRSMTGLDAAVGDYIRQDADYDGAFAKIADLLVMLLPRYRHEGKAYLTVAFGCTGGKHRSVFVAEQMALHLREVGYTPSLAHRDLKGQGGDTDELRLTEPQAQAQAHTAVDWMEPA